MNVSPVFNVPVKVHEIEIGPALKYIMNAVLRIWNGCRIVQHAVFQPDNYIRWPRQIGVKPPGADDAVFARLKQNRSCKRKRVLGKIKNRTVNPVCNIPNNASRIFWMAFV